MTPQKASLNNRGSSHKLEIAQLRHWVLKLVVLYSPSFFGLWLEQKIWVGIGKRDSKRSLGSIELIEDLVFIQ